eukprot:5358034-Karenia_brevis.AAC.1
MNTHLYGTRPNLTIISRWPTGHLAVCALRAAIWGSLHDVLRTVNNFPPTHDSCDRLYDCMGQRHFLREAPGEGDSCEVWSPIIKMMCEQLQDLSLANTAAFSHLGLLDDGPDTSRKRLRLCYEAS